VSILSPQPQPQPQPAPAPERSGERSGAGSRLRRAAGGDAALVIAPSLLAAVLCLISLTGRSLGFDEGATVAIVSQHGAALWRAIARDGGNMSGYYLLLHMLVGAFGDGPWVLRLPSVVFAGATPAVVAATALVLWRDRRAAGIAGLLCAVSQPLVYWGQTARGYAGMMCFTAASMLAFVLLVRAVEEGRPWRRIAVAYVVTTACAAYCGFIVVLIVPVQLVVLVRRRRALVRVATALAALAVLCSPIAVLAVRRGSGQLFWLPRPNHQVITQVMQSLTSAGLESTFHRVFLTTPGWIATAVVLLGLIGFAARSRMHDPRSCDRLAGWGALTVVVWIVLPGVIALLSSLVAQPIFLARNLLVSVPAVALALGLILSDRRLPRWLAGAALVLALLVRTLPVAAGYGASPEPWRQVTARVLAAARPGDCIAFYPEDARNAFRWYVARDGAQARAPRAVLPAVGWAATTPYVERYVTIPPARIVALASRCRRMWLVVSHEGQPNGPASSRRNRTRSIVLRDRLETVFGDAPVHTSGWASPIHVQLLPGNTTGG
jgi:hypothetical protein